MDHPIYPGMTAGEAREAGEDIPPCVPDEAVLIVTAMVLPDDSMIVLGARWEWDPLDAVN